MSKTTPASNTVDRMNGWGEFWFAPAEIAPVAAIRGVLCLLVAIFFVSVWADASFWYASGGPLSSTRVASFLESGGIEDAGRWILSPLFLVESAWVYKLYLIVGIVVAALVAAGRGGRLAGFGLWLLLVGWANRTMILSGLTETLLSLGLFAAAISPPCPAWRFLTANERSIKRRHWTAGFSQRLIAVQITIIGAATFVTMLAGRVWFNGIGAYALAAPVENRTFDWTHGNVFVNPLVHESLTHLMMLSLPLGFALAWLPKTHRVGQAMLILWCLAVAMLGSHWLYAFTFATMVCAIRPGRRS